jgi:pimeloyl-ACP methyl ester carboxylesterase
MKTIQYAFCLLLLFVSACTTDHPMIPKQTFLLVHGGWHGAWAWKKVIPLLQAKGHTVIALDLPSHGADKTPPEAITLADYTRRIVETANAQSGPVVLVGHSSGGMFISSAAQQLGMVKVSKLIYLDAFLPKNGQSLVDLAGQFDLPVPGKAPFASSWLFEGPVIALDFDKAVPFLYHDCSAEDVAFAKANIGKQPIAPFATPVQLTDAVYGAIPKFYIVCTQARDFNKAEMAKNVPTQRIATLPTSHSPFLSQPQALTDLLIQF